MQICYIAADNRREWNSANWRLQFPCDAINKAGEHKAVLIGLQNLTNSIDPDSGESREIVEKSDILVIQRLMIGRWMQAAQYWQNRGKKIILDIDDAYHIMDTRSPTYKFWGEGKFMADNGEERQYDLSPVKQLWWGGKIVDAVSAPSRTLLGEWEKRARKTIYLPNFIPTSRYIESERYVRHKKQFIFIGWAGTMQHYTWNTDKLSFIGAIARLIKERPEVRIIVMGNYNIWNVFAKEVGAEYVFYEPSVPYDYYPFGLSRFDIGIAPLNQRYDSFRSSLKVLEYMLMGLPWVASSGPVYDELKEFGELVSTERQWLDALVDRVDHIEHYREKAAGHIPWVVDNWDIDKQIGVYIDAYQKLMEES